MNANTPMNLQPHSLAGQKRTLSASQATAAPTDIREFLSFKLGSEEYGIDILRVQEIRSYEAPTRMASSPAFIKGVINLRGVIVPIIDMRMKFNLAQVNYNTFTVVIVLNIGTQVVGIVVDGVSDVITLQPEQLRTVPELSSAMSNDHVLAIGSLGDRMLIILDIEKLMTSPGMGLVNETVPQTATTMSGNHDF